MEEAAAWRDAIRAVQAMHERQQKMATTALSHRDVFGVKRGPEGALVQVFEVRNGRVVDEWSYYRKMKGTTGSR